MMLQWPRFLRPLLGLLLCTEGAAVKPLCRERPAPPAPPTSSEARFSSGNGTWKDCRVQIGGLVTEGAAAFTNALGPTFQGYLTDEFNHTDGLEFEALPLSLSQNFEYADGKKLDYIYSEPAAYTCMMVEFNIAAIASIVRFHHGSSLEKFAGVIFSKADSSFNTAEDLRRAHVVALSASSLGAMQLQQAELLKMGINILTDVRRITFTADQKKLLQEVQSGWADVGFAQTGIIDERFKVINRVHDASFPFARSTAFAPEWPLGALAHVPAAVSAKIGTALMRLDRHSSEPSLSRPGIAGGFTTWVPPPNHFELLSTLQDIEYYDPSQRKCLRAGRRLQALNCPSGWVKPNNETAFCSQHTCKAGYQCTCRPCIKLKDPALVLSVATAPTAWGLNIDGGALASKTRVASNCSRMSECAYLAVGQHLRWTLLDQIGNLVRSQVDLDRIDSVEMLVGLNGTWQDLQRESVTADGSATEQYVLLGILQSKGTHVVQLRINGQQAAMSPVVIEAFDPPQQRVFCPAGNKMESDGTCSPCPAGHRGAVVTSDESGVPTAVCLPCEPGMYQDRPGQAVCKKCSIGTITSQQGSAVCTRCSMGSSSQEGHSSCTPCSAGRYSVLTDQGQAVCSDCREGHYAEGPGSMECHPCTSGTSASLPGMARCLPCPSGRVAPHTGSAACTPCDRGFFTEGGNYVACQACGGGMTTLELGAANESFCQCPPQTYLKPGIGCVDCTSDVSHTGLECPGGNGVPLQVAGYWVGVVNPERRDYSVYRCRDGLECPRGPLGSCAEGHVGKACNNCKDGSHRAAGGACTECTTTDILPFVGFLLAISLVVKALFIMVKMDQCQQSLSRLTVFVVCGQVIVSVQALTVIHELPIAWVEPVSSILRILKQVFISWDILGVSCIFYRDDPITMFAVRLLAYPVFVLYLCMVALGFRMYGHHIPATVLFNVNGIVLFMVFISLTLMVWLPFQCAPNPSGHMTMSSQPGIVCLHSPEHKVLLGMAMLGTLVYPVTILAWATWTVMKYPSHVQSGGGLRRLKHHRFLFERFCTDHYYYGLVLLFRNLALVLIAVVLVAVPVLQLLAMGFVLLLGFALQCRLWPWRTDSANRADLGAVCCLLMVLIGAAPLLDSPRGTSERHLSVMLCIAVLGSLVCGLAAMLYALYQRFCNRKKFDIFLCHHKQGAGSFCRLLKVLLQKHSDSRVFLDSDNLQDLDTLFDIIRCNCKTFVVILSPDALTRIWCAGEIVTAHRNKISIVPVYCDGFVPLDDFSIDRAQDCWTDEEIHLLAGVGITMDQVKEAYRFLMNLPFIRMPRWGPQPEQERVVIELLRMSRSSKKSFSKVAEPTGQPKVLVLGNVTDSEALATCQIVETLIQRSVQEEVAVVRHAEEAQRYAEHAAYLVVVLSRGVLTNPAFLYTFMAVVEGAQLDTRQHGDTLEFVTINADANFEFPSADFYNQLDSAELEIPGFSKEHGPWLAEACRSLFAVLAVPLSPHGSESLMAYQLEEVCRRFRKLKDQGRASQTSDGLYEAILRRHPSESSRRSKGSIERGSKRSTPSGAPPPAGRPAGASVASAAEASSLQPAEAATSSSASEDSHDADTPPAEGVVMRL